MLEFTITAKGRSLEDVLAAITEARKWIGEGCHTGLNANDTGGYHFESSGQDDHDFLEEKGWEYDGEGWLKGRMSKPRSYEEALALEVL